MGSETSRLLEPVTWIEGLLNASWTIASALIHPSLISESWNLFFFPSRTLMHSKNLIIYLGCLSVCSVREYIFITLCHFSRSSKSFHFILNFCNHVVYLCSFSWSQNIFVSDCSSFITSMSFWFLIKIITFLALFFSYVTWFFWISIIFWIKVSSSSFIFLLESGSFPSF